MDTNRREISGSMAGILFQPVLLLYAKAGWVSDPGAFAL